MNSGYSSEQRQWVDQELQKMLEEFSVIDNIKLAVCSWNMGGVKPYSEIDLKDWLLPGITDPADYPELIIVGLQHIMPNKRSGMFNKN